MSVTLDLQAPIIHSPQISPLCGNGGLNPAMPPLTRGKHQALANHSHQAARSARDFINSSRFSARRMPHILFSPSRLGVSEEVRLLSNALR